MLTVQTPRDPSIAPVIQAFPEMASRVKVNKEGRAGASLNINDNIKQKQKEQYVHFSDELNANRVLYEYMNKITKRDRNSNSIYMLFTGREVRIGKNCARCLEGDRDQDRGHSFSLSGPSQVGE